MTHGILPPAPVGFTHHFATVNGLRFHYVDGGLADRRVVLLLAGFPESWYAWRKVMPLLSERFRVVAIDLLVRETRNGRSMAMTRKHLLIEFTT